MQKLLSIGLLAAVTALAAPARGQDTGLAARGKGIAGGILLGGELAAFSGGALDLQPDWVFASSIGLGAAAGGLAGFVVEREAVPGASDALLIAGLGLLVPVIVWVGDMRAPKPVEGVRVALAPRLPRAESPERGTGFTLALSGAWR